MVILLVAVFIVRKSVEIEDYDQLMVRAIKKKLFELNQEEGRITDGRPRFEWTCNKDCLWISISLRRQIEE